MDELKGRLMKELQHDFNVKIIDSLSWSLPVHSIEISYQTVKRTKMDILMKMMLISFQKAEIASAEELSDILLVEQLFINELVNTMSRTGLIEKRGGSFALTEAGEQQLENGVYEHEPESGTKKALYSPHHEAFLSGELTKDNYEEKEIYRHQAEFHDWTVTSIEERAVLNALKTMAIESGEGNVQVVVSEIISVSDLNISLVPCLEFLLYNEAEDLFYARVWNTLSEHWDETLETQLNDKERKEWRETYL